MTIEQRTQVMDAINIQCIINAQIDKKGACEPSLADRLNELLDTFTIDQEDLFVIKMSHKKN